ncbi:MAG: hypothetical protein L6R40_005147 [Gallowayella cf. fulva]|nr:MAG: hypothetical protein L6R40_005147 [Xanthomendoza cf. fulva]
MVDGFLCFELIEDTDSLCYAQLALGATIEQEATVRRASRIPIPPGSGVNKHYINMSNTESYSTFTSSSYSSSSDGTGNSYTEATVSNPSGTTIHRTSQEAGQPAVSETTRLPAGGTAAVQGGTDTERRIEDVTDADRQYEERMEDEYAKREGGA